MILEPKKLKSVTASIFPLLFSMKWWDQMPWSLFYECRILSQLFHSALSPSPRVIKSCLTLVTPWTVACHAPLSMGFAREECWSGLLFPSPGDLPDSEVEPMCLNCRWILYHLSYRGHPQWDTIQPLKSNENFPFETTLVNLNSIMLSYIIQTEK